jgi:transketolase
MPQADKARLIERAYSVKKRFLAMYKAANAGHIGCSLSCAEMLVFLKFAWMKEDDRLILSKGHAAAALYSVLAEAGALSESDIETFYRNGTVLPAHPPVNKIPGIPFATGSLGHGLSLSAGMALAARLKNQARTFFCVTSDGELDEGSVWEAALFISHQNLHNVIWLIDRNMIQGIGRTEEVMALEPLDAKLRAFGFVVTVADGHDFESLGSAREACARPPGRLRPNAIICHTVKGNGISFFKDTVDCHYLPLRDAQYEQAMTEIDAHYRDGLRRECP